MADPHDRSLLDPAARAAHDPPGQHFRRDLRPASLHGDGADVDQAGAVSRENLARSKNGAIAVRPSVPNLYEEFAFAVVSESLFLDETEKTKWANEADHSFKFPILWPSPYGLRFFYNLWPGCFYIIGGPGSGSLSLRFELLDAAGATLTECNIAGTWSRSGSIEAFNFSKFTTTGEVIRAFNGLKLTQPSAGIADARFTNASITHVHMLRELRCRA